MARSRLVEFTVERVDQATLEAWGRAIGQQVARPTVLALEGPLGAGKSTLARAIARGAGVVGSVASPTYNLVFSYDCPGLGTFVHIDLYRLESEEGVVELGWDELFQDDALVAIEWPQRAGALLPPDRWRVQLALIADDPTLRSVTVERIGSPNPLPAWQRPTLLK